MSDTQDTTTFTDEQWMELASLSDYFTTYGQNAQLSDIKLTDLYAYLQNPYAHIVQIRKASKYLTNKNGVLKEVIRTYKSLPTLEYMTSWSEYSDEKKIRKYERKVEEFIEDIDVVELVKTGLQELADVGTVVTCLRSQKYVQFLDLDDLRIVKMKNGKWIVEYDLKTIQLSKLPYNTQTIIESLPDEVTVEKYNLYRNKGEDYRYVELKNCDVISLDAPRNMPYGLPLTFGSWASVLQKEIINRVERSVANRLIKQIFVLKAGYMDKNNEKLVPKPTIEAYFKSISRVLAKKEDKFGNNQEDMAGTGLISLLQGLEIDALEVNTDLFKKELYEKIDSDIYQSLGVSPQLIWGGGSSGNYSSAEMNSQKFLSTIFDSVRKFEKVINGYLKQILPKDLKCNFKFFRSTINDKQKNVDKFKDLYMQTGISKYWLEALTGLPYKEVIRQAEYEKKELHIEEILYPASNAFTQSGNNDKGTGRPQELNPSNPNTIKSKGSGGNSNPKPSTN